MVSVDYALGHGLMAQKACDLDLHCKLATKKKQGKTDLLFLSMCRCLTCKVCRALSHGVQKLANLEKFRCYCHDDSMTLSLSIYICICCCEELKSSAANELDLENMSNLDPTWHVTSAVVIYRS